MNPDMPPPYNESDPDSKENPPAQGFPQQQQQQNPAAAYPQPRSYVAPGYQPQQQTMMGHPQTQAYANPGFQPMTGAHPPAPVTTQNVIINQPTTMVSTVVMGDPELQTLRSRNTRYLIFSCVVLWCCNLVFGGIAAALAFAAQSDFDQGRKEEGKCKSCSSLVLSILGAVSGIILVIVVIDFYTSFWPYY